MIDDKQIRQWLKEGTITQDQANKMLADTSSVKSEEKSNKFIAVVAIIGAVLIFIGFAWLIAKNWHQIPDFVKVLILASATLAAFISGAISRQKDHEGVGRSLITLGALLYILSLFLISQIYNLTTTPQHYAWLLFFAWAVVMVTAYFMDSPENVVISMLTFFPWIILQYIASILKLSSSSDGWIVFSFILIFLSAGVLLYGLSVFHNSIKHKFTNIYRFWTVFYFTLIFYLLSFQSMLPILSEYTFEGSAFSFFLVLFIILCLFGLVFGALFAVSKRSTSIKEIAVFLGVLAVLFVLILATKIGAGLVGSCYPKSCYDLKDSAGCNSAQSPLNCEWATNDFSLGNCKEASCNNYQNETECNSLAVQKGLICEWRADQMYKTGGYCDQLNCYSVSTEAECSTLSKSLKCTWDAGSCQQDWFDNIYEYCAKFDNLKDGCEKEPTCNWNSNGSVNVSKGLPTSLWLLWILNNIVFIGFIILLLWYGQNIGSTKIVNLALFVFILDIISRYIGFWMDFKGYFAFSVLAIIGGLMLIFGAWQIPKWRRKLLEKTKKPQEK